MLNRIAPWLFVDVSEDNETKAAKELIKQKQDLASFTSSEKQSLINRIAILLPKLDHSEANETYKNITATLRALAEDHVTEVRVAVASALKDIADIPHIIARQLADDVERAVAEPILRFCLELSDQDLIELITLHENEWHVEAIASRKRLSQDVSHRIAETDNSAAHRTLINNDGALISRQTLQRLSTIGDYHDALAAREELRRQLKREWAKLTDRALYIFLRDKADLNRRMTKNVMKATYERIQTQHDLKQSTAPLDDRQLRDTILLGETDIVLRSLSARSGIPLATVRRMVIDVGSGRAVMALCVRANVGAPVAVTIQQRMTRLPPSKIIYAREDDSYPLSAEELQWQYEFFGI